MAVLRLITRSNLKGIWTGSARRDLLEQLYPFAGHRRLEIDETGDVAARPRQALDKAAANRIGNDRENNGDGARLLQPRRSGGCVMRENEIGLQRSEFLRESLRQLWVERGPAIVEPDVAALRPPKFLESLLEFGDEGLSFPVALSICHQHADPPHALSLLRARRERPCNRSTNLGARPDRVW